VVSKTRIPNPAFDHGTDFVVNANDQQKQEISQTREKIDRDLVLHAKYTFAELAIGKKSRKYIAIFKKIAQGNFIIPSSSAGIFGLAWLIYRRASVYGFIVYSILIALAYEFVTKLDLFSKEMQIAAIFAFTHLVFYFIGNSIYFYSVTKKISNCRKKFGETSAMTYLAEQGGTLSGFTLLVPIFLLQGGMLVIVASCIYFDDFFLTIWNDFMALAGSK
jgi:hypothetical protein|tara:strand:- start:228 stop:884 length:657 start_codon:yes stop_codon:yes gene_type:complete